MEPEETSCSQVVQSPAGMNALPPEVLVHIFSFLNPADLLGPVRAVCSQWRELAVHKDAWVQKSITLHFRSEVHGTVEAPEFRLMRQVLRLAPCLHSMDFDWCKFGRDFGRILANSTVRVHRLRLKGKWVRAMVPFLQKQVPHLKYLYLRISSEFNEALAVIEEMDLIELELQAMFTEDTFRFQRPFRSRALQRLKLILGGPSDSISESLVIANATSLKEFINEGEKVPLTVSALASHCVQGLDTVVLSSKELKNLAGLKQLNKLVVYIRGEHSEDLDGLRVLSQAQVRPKDLKLWCDWTCCNLAAMVVTDWLEELATSRRRWPLESLTIESTPNSCGRCFQGYMTNLHITLGGLKYLRVLRLPIVPRECDLDKLHSKSLQLLDLAGSNCSLLRGKGGPRCFVPMLRRFIERTPGLHITGLKLHRCVGKCRWLRCHCLAAHGGSLRTWRDRGLCGLRGDCPPDCGTCAQFGPSIEGRWVGNRPKPTQQREGEQQAV